MAHPWWPILFGLAAELDAAGIPYSFDAGSAFFLHGMDYPWMDDIDISVEWGRLERAAELFSPGTAIEWHEGWGKFRFHRKGVPVDILSYKGTVMAHDPDRVPVEREGRRLWAKSLAFFQRNLRPEDPRQAMIAAFLAERTV